MTLEKTPEGARAIDLAEAMTKLWKGNYPAVVGAALAQALAVWIATLPEKHRAKQLEDHITSVRRMIPIVVEMARIDHQGRAGRG